MVPVCPVCSTELEYDEQEETYYEGDSFNTKWRGGCPTCNRNFTWWENYTLTSIDDMQGGKEIEEYEVAKFDAIEHGFVGTYALKVERAHYIREAERLSKLCKELAKKLEEERK